MEDKILDLVYDPQFYLFSEFKKVVPGQSQQTIDWKVKMLVDLTMFNGYIANITKGGYDYRGIYTLGGHWNILLIASSSYLILSIVPSSKKYLKPIDNPYKNILFWLATTNEKKHFCSIDLPLRFFHSIHLGAYDRLKSPALILVSDKFKFMQKFVPEEYQIYEIKEIAKWLNNYIILIQRKFNKIKNKIQLWWD